MLHTETIPRAEWSEFFDDFSVRHQGWLATMQLLGSELGAQVEAREMSFAGISMAGPGAVSIVLGPVPEQYVEHLIAAPAAVTVARTGEGADAALQIEDAEGLKTLLRFRAAQPAVALDGLAPAEQA